MRLPPFTLKQTLVVGFFALLALYSLFQARYLLLGPVILIDSPRDGERVSENVIIVKGRAQNISYISFNDRPIYIDSEGNWSEKFIVSEGLNIIKVRARDRFGRETEKILRIVYN